MFAAALSLTLAALHPAVPVSSLSSGAAIAICFSPEEDCAAFADRAIGNAEREILVGAVDIVGGVIVQQLGGAVIERLSASAAESAYAGQKMARLGLVAMAACRPVEFRPGEAPSLSGLVSGLVRQTRKGNAQSGL